MKEMPLYKILRTVQMQKGCTLACVMDGDAAEEQLLLCDGEPAWQTGDSDFLLENIRPLQDVTATGMLKMGNTQVFAERFGAVPQLIICGGGHVAAAVVRLAKLLGLPVLAMDDRKEYADGLSEAGADKVICRPFVQALEQVDGGAETYFIVVTRAHAFDVACLKEILKKPAAYVGMMGSKGRAALVRRQLLEQGADARRVEELYAPIGLSIGSQTAEEIALSILAQVVAIKNKRPQTEGFRTAVLDAMEQADAAGQKAVLATIIARHGSTPREVGAKMLVLPDGKIVGSVGGGIMEHRTILAAQEMLADKAPAHRRICCFADDNSDASVAACGGSMELLLNVLKPGREL